MSSTKTYYSCAVWRIQKVDGGEKLTSICIKVSGSWVDQWNLHAGETWVGNLVHLGIQEMIQEKAPLLLHVPFACWNNNNNNNSGALLL